MQRKSEKHKRIFVWIALLVFPSFCLAGFDVLTGERTLALHMIRIALSAMLFLMALFGWGMWLSLKISRCEGLSVSDRILLALVTGTSWFYFSGIILGAVGAFRSVTMWLLMVTGLLLLIRCRSGWLQLIHDLDRWTGDDPSFQRVLSAIVVLFAGVHLLSGWIPPVFYDLLVYHLRAPAEFLRSGTLHSIPWNVFANSPMAFQLSLAPALVVDPTGEVSRYLLSVYGITVSLATYRLARFAGRTAALSAALWVLLTPGILYLQIQGTVDFPVAVFAVTGIAWARESLNGRTEFRIPCGLSLGLLIASRFYGFFLLAALPVLCLLLYSRLTAKESMKTWIFILFVAGLIGLPFLIRNAVLTGNPFYPAAAGWIGGRDWSELQAEHLAEHIYGPSLRESLRY